ncbi:MAG: hypothetical protein MZV64_48680 [Ignavibacteriales bacterium]|nr:hypothetical protein [Ignavibacteriales bacterium]
MTDVGLPGKNGIDILQVAARGDAAPEGADAVACIRRTSTRVRAFRAGAVRLPEQGERAREAARSAVDTGASPGQQVRDAGDRPGADREPECARKSRRRTRSSPDREFQTLKLIASGKRLSDIADDARPRARRPSASTARESSRRWGRATTPS